MSHPSSSEACPRGVLATMLRHKKKIVLCPLAALLFGGVVFVFYPRAYRSEARLLLRVGRESVGLDPTATTGQTIPLQQSDRKDEVKSALEILRSRHIVSQAVDRVGVDAVLGRGSNDATKQNAVVQAVMKPAVELVQLVKSVDPISDREAAIVEVERHLDVGAERESTVVSVEYEAETPQLAQAVCEAIVEVYLLEHMRIHRNADSRPFFAEQQERLRDQLDESLEAVRRAKNEMGLSSVDQRRATLEAKFSAVELDRLSTQQQMATAQARIVDLERQLAAVPERLVATKKSVPNQGADLLRDQLYALQVKAMDLQARYNDAHPLVQSVQDQLNEAKQVMEQQAAERLETTDNINLIHRELSLDLKRESAVLAGCKARLSELDEQKKIVLDELRGLNEHELKIDQLSRQADLARGKFFQYAENMEEARIDKELESQKINNVGIVQPATLAEKPVSPSKPLLAVAVLILATAGTGALVLASEQSTGSSRAGDDQNGAAVVVRTSIPRSRVHRRSLTVKSNGNAKL